MNAMTSKREQNETNRNPLSPSIAFGLGCLGLLHGAVLFSLPPVLKQKGAPYLPTSQKGVTAMFQLIRQHPHLLKRLKQRKGATDEGLQFVDLGSGDGRVVFAAAREGIFHKSIGYEINPVLHGFATTRRIIQAPKYWSTTDFALRDIWSLDLSNVDVIAVYGLSPIMKQLGKKLKNELQPGSIVVSNVFVIPNWKPIVASKDAVHIYSVPESIQENEKK